MHAGNAKTNTGGSVSDPETRAAVPSSMGYGIGGLAGLADSPSITVSSSWSPGDYSYESLQKLYGDVGIQNNHIFIGNILDNKYSANIMFTEY